MSKWLHVQYTDLLQRLFPLALFWQTQCNIGKKEDKLEFFMRQNYIAAVHASRAGLSDLVGPSTIAYFDLTLAFETVPFVHTLFFLHCKYFHSFINTTFHCVPIVNVPYYFRMETSCGQWILVDTFFQNGRILLDIFWGWILVDTFGEFSLSEFLWTFFGWILVKTFWWW